MAEPIPSASAAAEAGDDEVAQNLPANAEDRKAAAALNALNTAEMSQENGETANKKPSAAHQEALGKAMSRLEIASGVSKKKEDPKKTEAKKEIETKKKVKVAAEDVNFLVEELDLSKMKATELLRSHDGNANLAVKAFITPPTKA
ncbi:hypothetical protein LTR67_001632 [Exophiala xenobiotica]